VCEQTQRRHSGSVWWVGVEGISQDVLGALEGGRGPREGSLQCDSSEPGSTWAGPASVTLRELYDICSS
jgi:hypothetical protein